MSDMTQQEKNDLLIEYAKKGATGGLLMALQAGADVNHKGHYSKTALHHAAIEGHAALAQVLLGAGANINAADRGGRTALYFARDRGHPEMEALLWQHGAE